MATFKIYKLRFTSPLHIGDKHDAPDVSMRTIQSDTLQAALFSCLAKTGERLPDNGDMGFVTSSLFPYYQKTADSNPTFFLPMPFQTRPIHPTDNSLAKKVKKVKWVSSDLYGKLLAGDDHIFGEKEGDYSYLQGSYLTTGKLPKDEHGSFDFIISSVAQRVTIGDRTGRDDAKPYYVDRVLFKDFSGLYFLVAGDTSLADKAMAILANEGIGTDRNVGFGFFSYSTEEIRIETPEKAEHQVALSLLIPASEGELHAMLDSEDVAYDFDRRGGWITSFSSNTLRKNAIYAFLPGSVFKDIGKDIQGKIVDLKPAIDFGPSHPIWRDGRSIMLPIKRTSE